MAYKVWIHLRFPEGKNRVAKVEQFVEDRDDLEIEGINRFARPHPERSSKDDSGEPGQEFPLIIMDGYGVELSYLAPDEEQGPDHLLAMVRLIARLFPESYIADAMRDFSRETKELYLEFTAEELNREMVAIRGPIQ